MGTAERGDWLDLLRREADGELTGAERAQVAALSHDPEFGRLRASLTHAETLLRMLEPPRPAHSLAPDLASEIAWSAHLTAGALPAPSRRIAAEVAREVGLSARLGTLPPPATRSVAPAVASEVAWSAALRSGPVLPGSLAAAVTARIGADARGAVPTPSAPPPRPHNPAPTLLVGGLLVGLTLLGVTEAWPGLAAGADVLQGLVAGLSPLVGLGMGLLLLVSALIVWKPTPAVQRLGAGGFVLSAALTLPPLYQAAQHSGITLGQTRTVGGPVAGNVIVVGGDVRLLPGARVEGEVVTLFGDVRRAPGAEVRGQVHALLGRAPGDATAQQTPPPTGLGLATASAFRPLLGWLGGAAWGPVFLALTAGALGLLFVTGAAPLLARRQRHAPLRTLALGVLALAALIGPALALALSGLLVPSLFALAAAFLLIATGLSVSAYDAGRVLACRFRLPQPDAVGSVLGLGVLALCLAVPPLALVVALVGGAWGAGTLLLTRGGADAGRSLTA
ncbi:polymer-forming cytoskeletal protein [Deinococcus sp. SDU3-2]|uniref:Polymer-forming cytoskeletal protein n=1 Tax=Deinococcus terrestris TaxID=2651870 RepID=A0A7X1NY29_9DEIO|nr:polymer-forming cytoskeletal protein [Deinococcus terrestris]MPY67833.1 polymer-forming cytoskeletal protein [Deinococcus terrestris]